jgi:hypothetical protein
LPSEIWRLLGELAEGSQYDAATVATCAILNGLSMFSLINDEPSLSRRIAAVGTRWASERGIAFDVRSMAM